MNSILFGLFYAIKYEHLLDFLDCKFLVNLSSLLFVTSDYPAIFYNQLIAQADNYIGTTGLVTERLQIFILFIQDQ